MGYYETKVCELLDRKNILAQLLFCVDISEQIEPFLKFLERDDLIIFEIYQTFKLVVEKLMLKIVEEDQTRKIDWLSSRILESLTSS